MSIRKLDLTGVFPNEDTKAWELLLKDLEKKAKKISQSVAGIWKGSGNALKNFTAQLEAAVQQTASASGKLRRSLADFDQIERLAAPTGSTDSATLKTLSLLEKLRDMGEGIRSKILDPISGWFSGSLSQSLSAAGGSLLSFLGLTQQAEQTTSRYASAWTNVGGHLSAWTSMVPLSTRASELLGQMLDKTGLSAKGAGSELQGMTNQGNWLTNAMNRVMEAAGLSSQGVQSAWSGMGNWFGTYVAAPIESTLSDLWIKLKAGAGAGWSAVKQTFQEAGGSVFTVLSQAWEGVKETFSSQGILPELESGVLSGFREAANRVIDGINGVISTPFSGLNGILEKLKSFRIGKLQPFKGLDFTVQTPKIPRLAQGAVIPPNREFLAVLGDQSHGTNIEAPLSTIQEAVAITMEDMIASNMAGHQATVELLREILQAVLGISVGDELLANAVQRYNTRMAVVKGGVL